MVKVITKINERQLAKTLAIAYGVPVALISTLIMALRFFTEPGTTPISVLFVGCIYPAMVFVMTCIIGWAYNKTVQWTGGIEIELEDKQA